MGKRNQRGADQQDLFAEVELFPVQTPCDLRPATDFNRFMATAMSEAIRLSGKSRERISWEMTEALGYSDASVTVAQLNAYTSAARETHNISFVRMIAFVRVTGATWLLKEALKDLGLTILEGAEAHFAQAGAYEKQARELLEMAEAARRAAPTKIRVPRGRA